MIIYEGTTTQFCQDVIENRIADIMANSFEIRFGYRPRHN